RLALVRNGFGAAALPADVKSLVLSCAHKINEGHMGPRKFWRQFMPRLKYHNPDVHMDVIRTQLKGGPATLTISFEGDRKEVIDVQHKHENDIVKQLLEVTGGKQLPIDDRDSVLANEYLAEKLRKEQAEVTKLARRAAKKEEERLNVGTV
ncbi:hypothetical protein EDC01DRAFT_613014, partial [Geopyxis carbonaria]